MTPALKKRTLDELIYAKGGFGRVRDDHMFLCRKLKLTRPAQASAILDNYVRFSQSRENPVALKFSESELEKLLRCNKTRTIREARRELIAAGLLELCGEDSKGVLICKANLDKIDLETADWRPNWEDDPAYAPVKAKPRGRSAKAAKAAIDPVAQDAAKSAVASGEVVASQQDTNNDQGKSAVVEDPNNPWEQVKGQLAGKLGPGAMHNWFSGTSFASIEDGTLTVEVPNPTTAAWIEQEYRPQIEASLRELSLDAKAVHYRVKSAAVVPGQFWRDAATEQTQLPSNSAGLPLEEKNTEEQLASQLAKLTQPLKPDPQTTRNLNRVFAQLPLSLRGSALEGFARKIQGYGKRQNIGGGILVNDAKEVCADIAREHQPFYYFEFGTLEQALAQMAADEQEARKHPDRAELLHKRPWMPQPIPFPRGTPEFLAEFERLFQTIPRKFMGREHSTRGGLSIAASV